MLKLRSNFKFNLSIFNKLMLSYLVMILLPTVCVSYLNYQAFSRELADRKESAYKEDLRYLSRQIDLLADSINAFSLQLSLSSDMNDVLTSPETSMYRFNEVKKYLNTNIVSNNLFYSAYLYMQVSDTVLTTNEGMFKRSDFYDKRFLDQLLNSKGDLSGYELRTIQEAPDKSVQVFTFARSIPVLNSYPLGQVIINVKKETFMNALQAEHSLKDDVVIFDSNRNVIFQNIGAGIESKLRDEGVIAKLEQSDRMDVTTVDGKPYLAYGQQMNGINWTIARLEPYSVFADKLREKKRAMAQIDLIVFLAGLVLSYLLAVFMYNPWRKIISGLSGYFKQPYKARAVGSTWVTEAVNDLITENHTFRSMITHNEPIIRERFVYDMMNRNYSPETNLEEKFRSMGIGFKYANFLVMIASSDPQERGEAELYDHKLLTYSYIMNIMEEHFVICGTVLDSHDLGFILNVPSPVMTDSLRTRLKELCRTINEWVQEEMNMSLQFSFGGVFQSLGEVSESFEQARQVVRFKAVIHQADTAFYDEQSGDSEFAFPLTIQKQLLYSIGAARKDIALQSIEELFTNYIYNQKYPRESLHEMIVQLIVAAKSKLLEDGVALRAVRISSVSDVFACSNAKELHSFVIRFLDELFQELENSHNSKTGHNYVDKAIQHIEAHYMDNLSISDIAEELGISSSYLSRFFKAETGKSPLEYLTEYRIAVSKELLKDHRHTLKDISEKIGYNDVNSFIRYFKKYEGITPGKYRESAI